jgi:hypothetical protein
MPERANAITKHDKGRETLQVSRPPPPLSALLRSPLPLRLQPPSAASGDYCSSVTRGSSLPPFFTYLSSQATHRAQRSSVVSTVAGPWSSYGYM